MNKRAEICTLQNAMPKPEPCASNPKLTKPQNPEPVQVWFSHKGKPWINPKPSDVADADAVRTQPAANPIVSDTFVSYYLIQFVSYIWHIASDRP